MNIQLEWDNAEHTCILWTYGHGWSWADFREAAGQLHAMLTSTSNTVDVIFDTGRTLPPVEGILFNEWNQAISGIPANLGILVVANGIPFATSVATIYGKIVAVRGITLLTATTVQEARQHLRDQHASV